ncbi:Ig-like domain-containing protein [Salinicoccus kekensis]|uniref:Bacterial Ig domain-containing protein n=1 Tax=Salinicoccus kekensis TaxID=714307 RepID=A0A285UFX0_9STAP|nr:Ig-like domain-containing protein [Salinicoccus kekensis]SOC40712.1 hypothetical protein SAMN05878391_1076 [Salinicoccus kekensis]
MKKLIIWTLAFILIFTEILFPIQMNAEEITDQCEDMAFKVEEPIAVDEKLVGEGQAGQEIEVLFNNLTDVIKVDDAGSFEYEWKDEVPEAGGNIILKSGPYEIELTVKEEGVETEPREAKLVEACEVSVIPEEEPVEEIMDDEDQLDVEEEQSGAVDEEVFETEQEVPVESSAGEEATSREGNESDKQTESEEVKPEKTPERASETHASEGGEEPVKADEEGGEETLVDEAIDESSEEKESGTEETGDETLSDESKSDEVSHLEGSEGMLSEENDPGDEADQVEESAKENSREEDNKNKLEDDDSEEGEEDNDERIGKSGKKKTLEVDKDEENEARDNKMVKGAGFSLFNTFSTAMAESEVPIIISEDTNSVYVSTPSGFNDALGSKDVERIILMDHIQQPKPSVVESETGKKIIDGNGKSIDLVNSTMILNNSRVFNTNVTEMVIRNTNLLTTNDDTDGGFIKKETHSANIHLENVNFDTGNNGKNGKLGSSWESTINFYGSNIINTRSSQNGMAFKQVIVHEGAKLTLHNEGNGSAFKFENHFLRNGVFGLEIRKNSNVEISSESKILETNLTRLGSRVKNIIQDGAQVIFKGNHSDNLFDIDTNTSFMVTNAKLVSFNNENPNGGLFSVRGLFGIPIDASFEVYNVVRKYWYKKDRIEKKPDVSVEIQEDKFTLDSNSNIRRMDLEQPIYELEPFEVDAVSDTHAMITGKTRPRATVIIYDIENVELAKTESDSEGNFSFTLKEHEKLKDKVEAGTVLTFKGELDNAQAETEMTVQGNRLQFIEPPPDIIFETAEIKNEEKIIKRESPHYDFEVVNTRKNSDWKLTAQAVEPLNDGNGNELRNTINYFYEDGNSTPMEKEPIKVVSKNTNGTQQVSWGPDEGILLKMNPIRAEADKEYSATINWTLSDGP